MKILLMSLSAMIIPSLLGVAVYMYIALDHNIAESNKPCDPSQEMRILESGGVYVCSFKTKLLTP